MLEVYPAIFHEEDSKYWVEFPDLEGCQSFGNTLEETVENAQEALGLYIASSLDNNEPINSPTNIKKLDSGNGFLTYISCDIGRYRKKAKAIKKTLSIPEWLNVEAEKNHINFSSVLQKALIDELQK